MTVADSAVIVDGVSKRFRLYRERNQSLKAASDAWQAGFVRRVLGAARRLLRDPARLHVRADRRERLRQVDAAQVHRAILRPEAGSIRTHGRVAALLELGSGLPPGAVRPRERLPQRLDPRHDQGARSTAGSTRSSTSPGIEAFIDQPVKNYSSGMYVRLGFSVAINVDPDILLVDEVLAVGDAAFQEKCMEKFADFRRAGKTVVIVSHAMGSLRTLCDQAAWLEPRPARRSWRRDRSRGYLHRRRPRRAHRAG